MRLLSMGRCVFLPASALALVLTVSCFNKGGDGKYDPKTQFRAEDGRIFDKCSGEEYNPEQQFCHEGAVAWKCGGKVYDTKKYGCANEELLYDREIEFFFVPLDQYNGVVYKKCGGEEYSPATQFCEGDKIQVYKCGDTNYNTETQFCHKNKTYDKCVSQRTEPATRRDYDPDKQRCQDGEVVDR